MTRARVGSFIESNLIMKSLPPSQASAPKPNAGKGSISRNTPNSNHPANMSYLEGSLGYALHRARLSVIEGIFEAFCDHRITSMEFLVLVVAAENPGINQADLAGTLDVERPRIVPTLNKLEKRGLAKRSALAADGRVKQIHVTKAGVQLLRVLQKRAEQHQNKTLARLDPTEARTIFSSLSKLAGRESAMKKGTEKRGRRAA